MRILLIIVAIVLALIGLTFLSDRAGSESYNAKYFKPGPVVGVLKALDQASTDNARQREIIATRMKMLELLKMDKSEFLRDFTLTTENTSLSGTNIVGAIQGTRGAGRTIIITAPLYAEDKTGMAVLLAVAERYSRKRVAPTHTLLLIAEGAPSGVEGLFADSPLPEKNIAWAIRAQSMPSGADQALIMEGNAPSHAFQPILEAKLAEAAAAPTISIQREDIGEGYPVLTLRSAPGTNTPENENDTLLMAVDAALMSLEAIDENLEALLGLPPLEP